MSDERKDKKTEKIFLLCFSESNNIIASQKILLHMYIYIHVQQNLSSGATVLRLIS